MSLKTFVDAYDFPAVSTRAANVYGAGQQLYRIIPRAIIYIDLAKPYNSMVAAIHNVPLSTLMMCPTRLGKS